MAQIHELNIRIYELKWNKKLRFKEFFRKFTFNTLNE